MTAENLKPKPLCRPNPLKEFPAMRVLTVFLLILFATSPNAQVSSAFTYQGELLDAGEPANGDFDFEFSLYFSATGGGAFVGPVRVENVAVENGLFTSSVDFGAGVYGAAYQWIEIAVRDGASTGAFTTLTPRQPLTPTPLSAHAEVAEIAETAMSVEPGSIDTQAIEDGSINLVDVDSTIQARVGVPCAAGSAIRRIFSGGTVLCEPIPNIDAVITGVAAGTGLVGGGDSGDVSIVATRRYSLQAQRETVHFLMQRPRSSAAAAGTIQSLIAISAATSPASIQSTRNTRRFPADTATMPVRITRPWAAAERILPVASMPPCRAVQATKRW